MFGLIFQPENYCMYCTVGKTFVSGAWPQCQKSYYTLHVHEFLSSKKTKRNCFYLLQSRLFLREKNKKEEDIKVPYSWRSHFHPVSQLSLSSNLFGGVMLITLGYLQWELPPALQFCCQECCNMWPAMPSHEYFKWKGINVEKIMKNLRPHPTVMAQKFNCVSA